MAAVVRACALGALAAAACGDDPGGTVFDVSDAALTYAAWQDGDGAWQLVEPATPLRVSGDHHTVAIACEGVPGLWIYVATDAPTPGTDHTTYGCDPNAAIISTQLWYSEPAPLDPQCRWADPPGTCPTLLPVAVTVTGGGADAITIVSQRSSQVIAESPTEAQLIDPDLAGGEQSVTVVAQGGAGFRSLTQPVPARLPFVLPAFALPPAVDVTVARAQVAWSRPVGRAFVELRTPTFAIRETGSAAWFEAGAVTQPVIDPQTLPGWPAELGGFAAGATVTWDVDLFDLGDAAGPTRAGAAGPLIW